jgi:hypothetical protein
MNDPAHPPPLPGSPRPSPWAIWSLVLGVLSPVCCLLFTGLPAVICGHKARARIRGSGGTLTGEGLALAGLVTGYLGTALGVVVLSLVLSKVISNRLEDRDWQSDHSCLNNLRMLEGAKRQWALENKKRDSEVPTTADVDEYLRGGFKAIRCPQGGTYTLNAVDHPPTCSVRGHALPATAPQRPQ